MYDEIVEYMKSKGGTERHTFRLGTIVRFTNRPSIAEVSEKFKLVVDEDGDGLTQGGELVAYWIEGDYTVIAVYK